MRTSLIAILGLVILLFLNFNVYRFEQIKRTGEVLLLELTPVDPRSILQGDYMRLNYSVARISSRTQRESNQRELGYIVVRADLNNVGQFERFYDGEELEEGEKLLRFRSRGRILRIAPGSFFFQEGHARFYSNAEYAMFKFNEAGNYLLVGLADAEGNKIEPETLLAEQE